LGVIFQSNLTRSSADAEQETQLSLTNRATRLEVSQCYRTLYRTIIRYRFVLLCYSNSVRVDIRHHKCRNLENLVKSF